MTPPGRRRARPPAGLRIVRAWAVLAVPVLLSGCGGAAAEPPAAAAPAATSGPAPATALPTLGPGPQAIAVEGEPALVVLPERPNGRLVLYAHGYGADSAALLNDTGFGGLVDGLAAAGYAVAASDAGGDAWGSAASVDAYAALAATVAPQVGAGEVFLVAESMGGLAGSQLVEGGRVDGLRAYAGISPLCDLSSVYDEFAESIHTAYGSDVDDALDELSPVPLGGTVPVRFWASDDDRVVDRDRNALVCASQVAADGGSAEVVEATGDHGDPSNFDLDGLLGFFDAAAG